MTFDDAVPLFDDDLLEPAGRPERFTTRWRLVGAGLANVWRYGDLQLDAASGRLLLRGPNGTGKTTALEALWPYLLDLNPQRLAAGKARPTSLSLLMREGAGGNRRRCGYLWLTLAAPAGEGVHSYGVRLLFSENSSPAVRVIPFTVPGVPLRDMPLYGPNRASLSDEQFRDTVTGAGGTIFADEDAYVGHLAGRLWRADEQALLELATRVRAVRNPNLLGDVSPQAAANALRDALPGVSDDVVTATAEALAESEATRTAFQRDRDAAVALERFAEAWDGHVVDVITAAHTGVTEAMKAVTDAERKRRRAEGNLETAKQEQTSATGRHEVLQKEDEQLDAEVRALENSEPYKAAGRLTDLAARVEAEQGRAAEALSGFRDAVDAGRRRAENLTATAAEISTDIEHLTDTAAAVDPQACLDQPALTVTRPPRQPYAVGGQSIDPGPGAVVTVEKQQIAHTAGRWRALAAGHQTKGSEARLALTDRRDTNDAEAEAVRLKSEAAAARVRAEREQQQLADAAGKAHRAVGTLIDEVDAWYAEHSGLGAIVTEARGPDAGDDAAWQPIDMSTLSGDEPARVLAEIDGIAAGLTRTGEAAAANLRVRADAARAAAGQARDEAGQKQAEALRLRSGKLLPIPRPNWAGPAPEGQSFADAVAWHPNTTDPTLRSLVETALSASGLLGASLRRDGAHTTAWSVDANGNVVHPNLATVLVADPTHPDAALADRVLHRVPLLDNSEAAGSPAGLVIGRDGTFSVGPLHGRPPGTDDAGQLRPAEYVGAAQRRAAALKRAAELEEQAASLELDATRHDQTAGQLAGNASKISSATQNFPPRSAAHTAEATRAVAAGRAANAAQDATDAEQAAAEQAEIAQERRLEWEQRTRARGLPIDVSQLTSLRDNGERNAKELTTLAKQLAERFTARLDRLAADIRDDNVRTDKLAQHHADTTTAVRNAQRITNEHQALVEAVGLNANVAVNRHAQAVTARNALAGELTRASRQADEARQTVERRGYDLEQAQRQVNDARPPVTAAQRQLRTLLNVGGVAEVLFDPDAIPDLDNIDALVAAVGRAVQGRRTTSRRTLRERYDDSRAELAGLWTLDPGDTIENLDTYHLTHDTVGYTPPAAADAGRQLRERAQAALDRAEESALREFVIGRLPLAIGTAWVTMEDWVKAVNRKMQNATASSGVRVRINKALPKT